MALKADDIKKLAELAKIKPEDLTTAITAEAETDINVPTDLHVYTDTEVTQLKNNEYKNGKEKGVEMAVKDTKEKLGLDFTGKTIDGLVEAAQKKAITDAKIEPDKKVTELNEKITNLQSTVSDYEKKLADKDAEVSGVKVNSEVFKHIPAFGENAPALGQDEVLQLMRANGYDFKLENGKVVASKDGKAVLDKVSNPVEIKDVVTGFLKEKKLITDEPGVPGGRGGGNGGGPVKFATLSELKKNFEDNKKSTLGQEFSEAVSKAVKENPDFAMDK